MTSTQNAVRPQSGRHGRRSQVMHVLRCYQTELLILVLEGDEDRRRGMAHKLATSPQNAIALRNMGDISRNVTHTAEEKLAAIMADLMDALHELGVTHLHTEPGVTALRDSLRAILEAEDMDEVFDRLRAAVHKIVSDLLVPLLQNHATGETPEDLVAVVMMDVDTALNKFRHYDFEIDKTVDFINGMLGWHLCNLGVSKTVIGELHPIANNLTRLLDPLAQPGEPLIQ